MTRSGTVTNALDFVAWWRRGPNEVVVAATCNCLAMLLSGHGHRPRRRQNPLMMGGVIRMLEVVTVRKDNISSLVAEYLVGGFVRWG